MTRYEELEAECVRRDAEVQELRKRLGDALERVRQLEEDMVRRLSSKDAVIKVTRAMLDSAQERIADLEMRLQVKGVKDDAA